MGEAPARICILGGGFAGLYTALYLSRWRKRSLEIVLIDRHDWFLFTPLIYDLLTQTLQRQDVAPQFDRLLAGTGIQFRQDAVSAVDLFTQQVHLASGKTLDYDRLVLAVGQESRRIGPVLSFRTLEDVDRLHLQLQHLEAEHIQVAIIGAGASGVELACTLAERLQTRGTVHLLDRRKTILREFPVAVQHAAERALVRHGVELDLNIVIESVNAQQITVFRQGQRYVYTADVILWAIGSQPWGWVRDLPCAQERGRVRVQPTLQLLDHPHVFALGDVAAMPQPLPATAQVALQQAKTAANNLKNSLIGKPLLPFRYRHMGYILTLGKTAAVVSSQGLCCTGLVGNLVRRSVYLWRMPTLRQRIRVGKRLLKRLVASAKQLSTTRLP